MTSEIQSELQAFRDMATRFAKKELEPKAIDLDRYPYSEFNQSALEAAKETGLLQVT